MLRGSLKGSPDRAAVPETNARAKNNSDAGSGETDACATSGISAHADAIDADANPDPRETNNVTKSRVDAVAGAFAENDVDSNSAETGCHARADSGETYADTCAAPRRQSLSRPPGC